MAVTLVAWGDEAEEVDVPVVRVTPVTFVTVLTLVADVVRVAHVTRGIPRTRGSVPLRGDGLVVVDDLGDDEGEELLREDRVQARLLGQRP